MGVLFILSHDFITQCDYFRAEHVRVEGAQRLTPAEVLHQAGIRPGDNILAVNLALARKRLLTHPLIAQASVGRQLPSTIVVRIQEHEPLAILDLGRKFLVNMQGEVFKEMDASDPVNLPVISGLTFSDLTVGGDPGSPPFQAVMAVLNLGKDLSAPLTNDRIVTIEVDREIGLTLFTADRIRAVKLGYDDYREKFRQLENILDFLESRQRFSDLETVDLNNLQRIVVKPTGAPSPSTGDPKEV